MTATTSNTIETTTRVIFHCTRRACKHIWAHDYQIIEQPGFRPGRTIRTLVRTVEQRTITASQDAMCPKCRSSFGTLNEVIGTVSDRKCDARCRNAKGPDCNCACGGKHHGAGYLV